MMIYCDIDGTLCDTDNGDYQNARPRYGQIEKINKLYYLGHQIVIWSIRGRSSGIDYYELTLKQLQSWGVKFHLLDLKSKPDADIFIDDRFKRIEEIGI